MEICGHSVKYGGALDDVMVADWWTQRSLVVVVVERSLSAIRTQKLLAERVLAFCNRTQFERSRFTRSATSFCTFRLRSNCILLQNVRTARSASSLYVVQIVFKLRSAAQC